MIYNDLYCDLPIDYADVSKHFSNVLLKELTLIYYRYPKRHDAVKACLDKASTFSLRDPNRAIWESCAESFRTGNLPK